MKNKILKSIWACFVGILVGAILSFLTDFILESNGILPHGNLNVSAFLVGVVIFYRLVYIVLGCYIVAKLAPSNPMKHVWIMAIIGFAISAIAAIITRNMNIGPVWYAWTLAILTLPASWLGGKLYLHFKK